MNTRAVVSSLLACAALICSACGSSAVNGAPAGSQSSGPARSSPSAGAARITLTLSGAAPQRFSACGSDKPFLTTGGGTPLIATGKITPVPTSSYRVKLKVKQCVAGVWQTTSEPHVSISPTGGFRTMVLLPGPGAFTVRAYYYAADAPARSIKAYARVTG